MPETIALKLTVYQPAFMAGPARSATSPRAFSARSRHDHSRGLTDCYPPPPPTRGDKRWKVV